MASKQLTDIELIYLNKTDQAIKVTEGIKDSLTGKQIEYWLPISQIELDKDLDKLARNDLVTVTLPEWLAKEKGLI